MGPAHQMSSQEGDRSTIEGRWTGVMSTQDAQPHWSSGKCKLKAQCLTPGMTGVRQARTGFGEEEEKPDPTCPAGGSMKWCSCCGEQLAVPQMIKHRVTI
jgi:hypothetical protein